MLDGVSVWSVKDTNRPRNLRHLVRAASKARGEHEMVNDKRPRLCIRALDLHRPLLRLGVLRGLRDGGGCPHVQFERVRIALQPICNLPRIVGARSMGEVEFLCYLWCRCMDGPGWREAASERG